MYRISTFSKITALTVKTLRYYDKEGILIPTKRDNNQYRYYSEDDFKKAKMISLLRTLEFSIAEIKEVLNCSSTDDVTYYLAEKKDMIALEIKRKQQLIHEINNYLTPQKRLEKEMNYQIEIKEIPKMLVASIRYQGKYSDVGTYIRMLYKELKGNVLGPPFHLYYDDEYKEFADMELCIPIKKRFISETIVVKELAPLRAITTTHIGGYDKINLAYKAILDYANTNDITCVTPSIEEYVKGPGMIFKGNPNHYVTNLSLHIKEMNQ